MISFTVVMLVAFSSGWMFRMSLAVYFSQDLLTRSNLPIQPRADEAQLLTHTSVPSNFMLFTHDSMNGVFLGSAGCSHHSSVDGLNSSIPAAVASHSRSSPMLMARTLLWNEFLDLENNAVLISYSVSLTLRRSANPLGVPIQRFPSSAAATVLTLSLGRPSCDVNACQDESALPYLESPPVVPIHRSSRSLTTTLTWFEDRPSA